MWFIAAVSQSIYGYSDIFYETRKPKQDVSRSFIELRVTFVQSINVFYYILFYYFILFVFYFITFLIVDGFIAVF